MSASLNSQHSTLNWPSPSPRLHPRMWHRHPADEYMGWKPMPLFKDWPNWEVVSSYSSATAPDSHGISCADPLVQARKELKVDPPQNGFAMANNYWLALRHSRFIYQAQGIFRVYIFSQSNHHWRRWFHRVQSYARAAAKISRCATDGDRRLPLRRLQESRRLSRRFCRAKPGDPRLVCPIWGPKVRRDFSSGFHNRHGVARSVRSGA